MKLVWLTDIHLNFINSGELDNFCNKITSIHPDGVLIGGDIGEAPSLTNLLITLEQKLRCPIYFVLGNHDYYHGSICDVREFFGLPDVQSLQNEMLGKIREGMTDGVSGMDAFNLMKPFMPAHMQSMETLQNAFWNAFSKSQSERQGTSDGQQKE